MKDDRPSFITFEKIAPGPVGSIYIHDAEGEGWHWECLSDRAPVNPGLMCFVIASHALAGAVLWMLVR